VLAIADEVGFGLNFVANRSLEEAAVASRISYLDRTIVGKTNSVVEIASNIRIQGKKSK
jgi:hypothetical protein